jgi:hypothetical protein
MVGQTLRDLYFRIRKSPTGGCVSPAVPYCWRAAVTLRKWWALEDAGYVRLTCEDDTDFVPGEGNCCCDDPECSAKTGPAYGSVGEYRLDPEDEDGWVVADSVWGHTGYRDVLDPFENPYILDIMAGTIEAFKKDRKAPKREEIAR